MSKKNSRGGGGVNPIEGNANAPAPKEEIPQDQDPSEKLICTMKGFHGRIVHVGEQLTRGQLIGLAGSVPSYFKPVGSSEANEAIDDSKTSADGFANNTERVNYLRAKGVAVKAGANKAELQKLISQLNVDPLGLSGGI